MGIRAETPVNIVLGAGNLTYGGVTVGATEGGSRLRIVREYFTPDLDGALADVMGTERLIRETATLEVTLAELTMTLLNMALPGAGLVSDASSEILTAALSMCIPQTDHGDVVLTVPRCAADGTETLDIVVTLENALAEPGLEIPFTDSEDSKYTVTFKAYVDASALTTPVWSIERETA